MLYILFAEYLFETSMEKEKLSPVLFLSTSAAGVIRLRETLPYLLLLKCLSTGRDACQLLFMI